MISFKELKDIPGHYVCVKLTNGMISKGFCTEYQPPADEDESYNITVDEGGVYYEINDYEIESIEILSEYQRRK